MEHLITNYCDGTIKSLPLNDLCVIIEEDVKRNEHFVQILKDNPDFLLGLQLNETTLHVLNPIDNVSGPFLVSALIGKRTRRDCDVYYFCGITTESGINRNYIEYFFLKILEGLYYTDNARFAIEGNEATYGLHTENHIRDCLNALLEHYWDNPS